MLLREAYRARAPSLPLETTQSLYPSERVLRNMRKDPEVLPATSGRHRHIPARRLNRMNVSMGTVNRCDTVWPLWRNQSHPQVGTIVSDPWLRTISFMSGMSTTHPYCYRSISLRATDVLIAGAIAMSWVYPQPAVSLMAHWDPFCLRRQSAAPPILIARARPFVEATPI